MKFSEYCIDRNTIIRDAMKKLNIVKPKILFLVDKDCLVGSLTDGDIRRYLLASGQIEDFAEKACTKNPLMARSLEEAQLLYNEKNYVAIPIVDENRVLLDIYLGVLDVQKPSCNLNIPVVINAGGKGTRLDLFTKVLPKPLIPVGEYPIIEHIMHRFEEYGCKDFNIIVNYKKQLIKAYFSEVEKPYNINWVDEEKPLGTGGGLSLLRNELKETFFFTNCDILVGDNYESMIKFHKENQNAITMICAYKNTVIPYGVIEMGKDGEILEMKEKPELSFLTNTGMYIVEPKVMDLIEDDVMIGFPDIIKKAKDAGMKVAAYPMSGEEWLDMGQIPELEKTYEKLSKGK